jgi:hypothetical protein
MVGGTDTFRNQIAESCRRAYFSAKFGQVSGEIFIFPQSNQTTPKMNHGHAGSAVAAALAALKSPLQKKKSRYSLSSGWARDNYCISLK